MITSAFAKFIDPFSTGPGLNRIDLVYSRRSVVLEFLNIPVPPATIDFVSFALTSNQLAGAKLLNAVELDPRATHLLSFFLGQPFANIPNDLDLFSPEALTAFYEIGFSGANIQRLTLENRLDEIRGGGARLALPPAEARSVSKTPPATVKPARNRSNRSCNPYTSLDLISRQAALVTS